MLHDEQTAWAGDTVAVAAMASRMAGRECLMIASPMLRRAGPFWVPGSAGVSPALRSPQQGAGGTPALPVESRKGLCFHGFLYLGSISSKRVQLSNWPVVASPVAGL